MEENSNYLPYFYFSLFLLISCLAFATTFNNFHENLLQKHLSVSRCTYEVCPSEVTTLTVVVQDTQINSFKKTSAGKMGLNNSGSKANESQTSDTITVAADFHAEMVAKTEWWIKRLIYDVRDISTTFAPPVELMNTDSISENSEILANEPPKPDKRIVDGILYINNEIASPEEHELIGLVHPFLKDSVAKADGIFYVNGEFAANQIATNLFETYSQPAGETLLADQSGEFDNLRATSSRSNFRKPESTFEELADFSTTEDEVEEEAVLDVVPAPIHRPTGSPVSGSMQRILLTDVYQEEIPCNAHYDYNWNTSNIHPYRYNLSTMPETVEFLLTHGLDDDFTIPVGGIVTSKFGPRWGRYHNGVDLDLDKGDQVKSAFDGRVRIAQYSSSYGYMVVVRHFNGLETTYAHLSKLKVSPNQDVKAGDVIGLGGSTGRSTGSHLHFEVRYKGLPLDPTAMIDFSAQKLKSHTFVVDKYYFSSSSPYLDAHDNSYNRTSYSSSGSSKSKYHVVRKGDTLYAIAQKHGKQVKEICRLNRISTNSKLQVGQKLRIK